MKLHIAEADEIRHLSVVLDGDGGSEPQTIKNARVAAGRKRPQGAIDGALGQAIE
jgi:hypothetical protein